MTPIRGKRDAIGGSASNHGHDRLALGFVLAPEIWGNGLATEAAEAVMDAAFSLTQTIEINASVRVENGPRGRAREVRVFAIGTGLEGAPARGGLVECELRRARALPARRARREASVRLVHAP